MRRPGQTRRCERGAKVAARPDRCVRSRCTRGSRPCAAKPWLRRPGASGGATGRQSRQAPFLLSSLQVVEGRGDASESQLLSAVEALRVDPKQYLDAVPGPFGDLAG